MTDPEPSPLLPTARMAQLERLELVSRKLFRGRMKGERRSRRKGQGVEFADFRGYVPGDDLRFLDWNLYARLDRLFLRMFLEEEDLHVYALIDASPSMAYGTPDKLRFAKELVAAIGFIALIRSDRLRVETLGQPLFRPGPILRGRQCVSRLLAGLDAIEPVETVSLTEGVRRFCFRNPSKGIVLLISDLMDKGGYESALRLLLSRQMDMYVIHVLCQEELKPELKGDLKLIDCEDHEAVEITVSGPLMKLYQENLNALIEGASRFCSQRGIAYLSASSQTPVETMVTSYLRARGLVH